ncbi:MAG: hypothetical protein ACR2NT_06785 [Acidimicrobiia bacterium]
MTYAAGGAAALIAVVALFQIMLALGVPWGAAAWGGRNAGVLPTKLRIASAASALLLGGIAWLVLARSASANPPTWLNAAAWIIAGYFALGTIVNAISRSKVERIWGTGFPIDRCIGRHRRCGVDSVIETKSAPSQGPIW